MTREEILNLLTTKELTISELAAIAKELKKSSASEILEKKEKEPGAGTKKPEIGYKTVVNYPDITITKTTAKTVQQLVIMPSQDSYFIRLCNNIDNPVEILTRENYAKFTSGMETIELEGFWTEKLEPGMKFFDKIEAYLKNDVVKALIKTPVLKEERCRMGDMSYYGDSSLKYSFGKLSNRLKAKKSFYPKMSNEYIILLKEFCQDDKLLGFLLNNSLSVEDYIKTFGLNNVRRFFRELPLSLSDLIELSNDNEWYYNSDTEFSVAKDLLRPASCQNFERYLEYVLYESVRMGYRRGFSKFLKIWKDDLNMQLHVYGEIKEKYPKNLQTHHDIITDKYDLNKEIIDAERLAEQVEISKTYEYKTKDKFYVFISPKDKNDFFEEAHQQSNCLASYVSRVAAGECHIMFMRKAASPDCSEVTIEVKNNKITQAYQASNRKVTATQAAEILEWANKFGFEYDY